MIDRKPNQRSSSVQRLAALLKTIINYFQLIARILLDRTDWSAKTLCLQDKLHTPTAALLVSLAAVALARTGGVHAQLCSESPPIGLWAKQRAQATYFHTPGYERGKYDSNMTCNWLLTASNPQRRLMLTVHSSHLDDALFTDCDDFCAVYDGETINSPEIVSWCGGYHPNSVISTADVLLVHFHSDQAFQGRGINMSFVDFEMPGCPPSWTSSSSGYCYSMKGPPNYRTWYEAQKECTLERSNLLTISSDDEYKALATIYANNKTPSWTGYTNFNNDGKFSSVDQSEQLWPEDIQTVEKNGDDAGCVIINWANDKDKMFALEDCRNHNQYVCKRSRDGSTIPYQPQIKLLRASLSRSSLNYSIWIFIFVLLMLLLILLYLWCRKFYENRNQSRVGSTDMNQRLVSGVDSQRASGSAVPQHLVLSNKPSNKCESPNSADKSGVTRAEAVSKARNHDQSRISTEIGENSAWPPSMINEPWPTVEQQQQQQQQQEMNKQQENRVRELSNKTTESNTSVKSKSNSSNNKNGQHSNEQQKQRIEQIVIESDREHTTNSTPSQLEQFQHSGTRQEALLKMRRNELFERPHVPVLQHASAISLDEFWRLAKQ